MTQHMSGADYISTVAPCVTGSSSSKPCPTTVPSTTQSPVACNTSHVCSADTVSCESPDQIAKNCGSTSDACSISYPVCALHLSTQMCKTMGYVTGQKVSPSQCVATGEASKPTTAGQVQNLCLTVHESAHAGDVCSTNGTKECQTEVNAYGEEGVCMGNFYTANCAPPRNGWTAQECTNLQMDMDFSNLAIGFNTCLCNTKLKGFVNGENGSTSSVCSQCTAQCIAQGGSNANCSILAKTYCSASGN